MRQEIDLDYYLRRLREEQEAAALSSDLRVQRAHAIMAASYEALLSGPGVKRAAAG